MRLIVVFCLIQYTVNAFFSINYSADESHPALMTLPGVFMKAPTPEHVADIYTRLSGLPPILREEVAGLPSIDVLAPYSSKPILLEITGGRLLGTAKSVVRSTAFDGDSRGPSIQSVLDVLSLNGIEIESKIMQLHDDRPYEVQEWIRSQSRPVVIMHHETPSAAHYLQRNLGNSTLPKALDEFQISQYQICLWTGVGMVLLILSSVCCIVQMEVIPDSLLYAKFQSARTHKND